MQKNYSLALGWWSAKWISHIGVIRYLEENKDKININEIAWTSMWAIIWACFATWMKSSEMESFLKKISFLKLIDLDLKSWLIHWKKIYKKLEELFWENRIEEAKIPLKIIATNLYSWEKEVFTSWKIVDAIRASISLPIIFKSFEINSKKYIDWWLISNLPVLELDWNNIIAVSVIRDTYKEIKTHRKIFNINIKKLFFWINYQILKKTINITMSTNENLSLEIARYKWKNITLLLPRVWNYEYHDFLKYNEIITKWYEEAQKTLSSYSSSSDFFE